MEYAVSRLEPGDTATCGIKLSTQGLHARAERSDPYPCPERLNKVGVVFVEAGAPADPRLLDQS